MSATDNVIKTLTEHFDTAMEEGDLDQATVWRFCLDNLNTMQAWMVWRSAQGKSQTTTPPSEDPEPAAKNPSVKNLETATSFYQRDGETLVMVAPSQKNKSYKQQIGRNTAFIFAQTLKDKNPEGFARNDAIALGREDFSLPAYKPLLIIRWLVDAGVLDIGSRGKKMTFTAKDLHDNMTEAWATLSEYPS